MELARNKSLGGVKGSCSGISTMPSEVGAKGGVRGS